MNSKGGFRARSVGRRGRRLSGCLLRKVPGQRVWAPGMPQRLRSGGEPSTRTRCLLPDRHSRSVRPSPLGRGIAPRCGSPHCHLPKLPAGRRSLTIQRPRHCDVAVTDLGRVQSRIWVIPAVPSGVSRPPRPTFADAYPSGTARTGGRERDSIETADIAQGERNGRFRSRIGVLRCLARTRSGGL